MQSVSLRLAALFPDPTQPRKSRVAAELEQLAASISERGVLLPLRVKPPDSQGRHPIVSGHRRFAAAELAGLGEVPCIIVNGPLDEATILAEQVAENVHREDLSPIDEASAFRRFITLRSISQAAQELAVPVARISRALPLLELPSDIQAAIHAGTVSKDAGYHLTRLPKGEERDRLMSQALGGSLSRDAAARAAKASRQDAEETPSISRVSFKFSGSRTLTFSAPAVRLDTLIEAVEEALREARKARSQGLDVSTVAKIFRDRTAKGGAA
jgi:ParB family transcriptional regulator, chromosome partitioning protein